MVSILAQERILGASLGAGFAAAMVLYEQKLIYRSAAHSLESISGHPVAPSAPKIPEPLFSKKICSELGHAWNIAIDKSLGSVIAYLSSRGW
ncbi:hypothetical protein SUGI_1118380 [Cryptomeria japonica]|uniref:uncharacterized protein LOC131051407 isoform X2 n=1 Tax=Cryptomeria japonica TaxID=3369 RepID=UPI0024148C28|nr:uncharacterized protein LOC131051407 isoform X2 [Cryptomeria japonica]GLJ52553.1 hypothetical protein SUGI_1118380 [Cryptomeria japonica]